MQLLLQGVPGKNVAKVGGIPLVGRCARMIRQAMKRIPGGPHRLICSTDDKTIAEVAKEWGAEVPFMRPAALAADRDSPHERDQSSVDR